MGSIVIIIFALIALALLVVLASEVEGARRG